jgi:prepilin-type N-terminal cleavage/methylation domain-containing protein
MEGKFLMKKYLNNERGLTLIELLAVLIIGAIIFLLISNIHIFSQKQYKEQTIKAEHLFDVTYAAKVITKEIRKSKNPVLISANEIHLDGIIYKFEIGSNSINKNGVSIASNIKDFHVEKITDLKWSIKIVNLSNKKIETELTFRKGS